MSLSQRIQDLAIVAITKIAEITASSKGKDAALALSVIEKIALAVKDALADKITAEDLAKTIEIESKQLADKLADNDQIIRDEIDEQFDK